MTWREINLKFVRQDVPDLRAQWFRDSVERGGGDLMVWLDQNGRAVRFKLTHLEWPSLRHYEAEWQAGSGVWVRQHRLPSVVARPQHATVPAVSDDDRAKGRDPDAAWHLLRYFRSNAAAIDPVPQRTIIAVLGEASERYDASG